MIRTRAQEDLDRAARLVGEVAAAHPEGSAVRTIYGGLCHSFPVLVRTCGLCQALAYSRDKAGDGSKDRNKAHALLLAHVGSVLGAADPVEAVRAADASDYIHHTRRVLGAWVYFKRFAVSILKVETAREAEEGRDGD